MVRAVKVFMMARVVQVVQKVPAVLMIQVIRLVPVVQMIRWSAWMICFQKIIKYLRKVEMSRL